MKLLLSCAKCIQEFGKPNEEPSFVEILDGSRYEFTCSHGHKSISILQQQKFEILFEIGLHAILDGYYREAVSSFSSSLECFYEFAIRAIIEKTTGPGELFNNCWREVSRQSERQLGAFIFAWALYFGEVPILLSENEEKFRDKDVIKFRNDVVHKGIIPTKEEAIKYGNAVLNVLIPSMNRIQERMPEVIRNLVFEHQRNCLLDKDKGEQITWMGIRTLVSIGIGDPMPDPRPIEKYLNELEKYHTLFR